MMEPFEICSGCELSEYDIIENFHKKNSSAIKFLENHGVLPKELWCPTCKTKCDFREEKNIFVCRNIIRGKKGKKKMFLQYKQIYWNLLGEVEVTCV